jgi:hypothetical protein
MSGGHEKPHGEGGPEPSRAWLFLMAIVGVVVLFGIEYFR